MLRFILFYNKFLAVWANNASQKAIKAYKTRIQKIFGRRDA
jgi:hypothetical protein